MKRLRLLHLYLGCVFTPLLLLFVGTGAFQLFGIRVPILSEAHIHGAGSLAFVVLAAMMALSVVITSISGILMAFRFCERRQNVWACLAFGTLVPAAVLVVAHLRAG